MSVRGHGRHDAPRLAVRVVTLHRVEGLESVPAAHHVEAPVEDGHAELQPAPAHGGHLPPGVPPQAVLLDAGGACSRGQEAVVKRASGSETSSYCRSVTFTLGKNRYRRETRILKSCRLLKL